MVTHKTTLNALEGEFGFSASGTSIIYIEGSFVIVTGGMNSRFISTVDMGKTWYTSQLPLNQNQALALTLLQWRTCKTVLLLVVIIRTLTIQTKIVLLLKTVEKHGFHLLKDLMDIDLVSLFIKVFIIHAGPMELITL